MSEMMDDIRKKAMRDEYVSRINRVIDYVEVHAAPPPLVESCRALDP